MVLLKWLTWIQSTAQIVQAVGSSNKKIVKTKEVQSKFAKNKQYIQTQKKTMELINFYLSIFNIYYYVETCHKTHRVIQWDC